jgi:hypothetical protein
MTKFPLVVSPEVLEGPNHLNLEPPLAFERSACPERSGRIEPLERLERDQYSLAVERLERAGAREHEHDHGIFSNLPHVCRIRLTTSATD